jgi:lipopolysaccharide biosynthesis glycosyltransferase
MKRNKNRLLYKSNSFLKKNKLIFSFNKILLLLVSFIIIFSFSFYSKKKNLNKINSIKIYNYIDNTINSKYKNKNIQLEKSILRELYNYEKKPSISILIINFDIINSHTISSKIRMLKNLLNQSINNIEILISLKKNTSFYYKILEFSRRNNKLKIIDTEYDTYKEAIKIIMKSKGKFITILNKCYNIRDSKFYEKLLNKTFGKINNYYEYKIENEVNYLIKSKVLKDYLDNELSFKNFKDLENYINFLPNQNLNYISIAFCLDNKYALYGYVSMISILETKNYNTFVSFYIIIKRDISQENKSIILSLYEQYDFLNISLIYMDDRYKNVKVINYLNQVAYFRLSLGELLPNLNRIIYLDSDVIVYNDLTNLFNTNFNGHMILCRKMPEEMKVDEIAKINTGILLLNLKKMRCTKFEKKIIKIINEGFVNYVQDQGLLIKYFLNDTGELNEKYNLPTQGFTSLINFYKQKHFLYKYNDLRFISNYPTIRHFNGPKNSKNEIKSYDWWYFASKSKYYSLIIKKYFNFNSSYINLK